MSKVFKKHRKVMGVILLILAVMFFIFWEFIGRKELLHSRIVVLNQDVEKGTVISYDMLTTINVETENLIKDVIDNPQSIIGLESKHFIPSHTQLISKYFDLPALVLTEDKKVMKIPNEWIFTYPDTLRRKDNIYLFAVKSSQDESQVSSENKTFVFSTIVAYVKDNANREVESLDSDRLTGSSSISSIEIIISEKEFKILENYANKGYKFAIMYQ